MRVGLVIGRFDPQRGGAELSTVQLASALAARGHQVHVVARHFGPQTDDLPVVRHRECIRSPLRFAQAAEARLRSLRLDLIHDMGAGWYCDILQPRAGSVLAVRRQKLQLAPRWWRPWGHVLDCFSPRYQGLRKLATRQCLDDGKILIAMSRMVADHFQQLHGVPAERIRLIYNGVDHQQFSPQQGSRHRQAMRQRLAVGPDTTVLLIVAHNFSLKGVPILIKAMQHLHARRSPVHLVVAGGRHVAGYMRWARRLGLAQAVTFTGMVAQTMPLYAAADLYVHPTLYDTCSRVVLEALASGLPVVTSRFDGASELLSDAMEGFVLADPTDLDELLTHLETLLDPAVRERMGWAARQLALQHSFARHLEQLLEVYDQVLGTRRCAA